MRSGPTEDLHDFFILLVAIKTKTVTRVTGGIICTCPLKPLKHIDSVFLDVLITGRFRMCCKLKTHRLWLLGTL